MLRWPDGESNEAAFPPHGPHAHDFLVLLYVEAGEGTLRVDDHDWSLSAGDAFVIAPGAVVTPDVIGHPELVRAWLVFFPTAAIGPGAQSSLVSWRSQPLLSAFAHRRARGAQRLHVPLPDRTVWGQHLSALHDELRSRAEGYPEAARALLTLILLRLARLDSDVVNDLRAGNEPLLASVFEVIEARFGQPLSLRDVARAVGLSPGHLTTLVGRRTGRTVQQWIAERRMREARHLLDTTDLAVTVIASRVGYRDAGYFTRHFRRDHGVTPTAWRQLRSLEV